MTTQLSNYHIVLMPIKVPVCDHCWDGNNICGHFDNEGGHPTCNLDLGDGLKYNAKTGLVAKPPRCLELDVGD